MTIFMAICLFPIVILVAYVLGKWVLTKIKIDISDSLSVFVFSTTLGFGVLGMLTLLLGLVGCLQVWSAYGLLLLAFFIGRKTFCRQDFLKIVTFFMETHKRDRLLLCVLLFACILNLIAAFAPPSNADAMAYHLALPKLFIKAQQIYYLPNIDANGPMNIQMRHLLGMLMANDRLAMLLAYFQGILLVLAMMGFCQRFFSKFAGILSATLLYTTPMITNIVSGGYVDVGLTLFTFLAFWALVEWHWAEQRSWLWVSGIFLGFVAGSKYYGLISVIVLPAVLLSICIQKKYYSAPQIFRYVWAMLLPAFLVSVPWYAKNFVYTGNPLYPVFFGWFGGIDWSVEANIALKAFMDGKRAAGNDWYRLFTIPWEMTMNGEPFMAGRTGYGPVFLAFCPLIFVVWKREIQWRSLLCVLFFFIVIFYVIWFIGAVQRGRHLLPIMPLVSILVAVGISQIWVIADRLLQFVMGAFLLVGLVFHLAVGVIYNAQFISVVLGGETESEHLTRKLHYYKDATWLNKNIEKNARVLHFYRTINYYLDVDYYFASIYFQGGIDWANMDQSEKLLSQLRTMGITHIFVDLKLNDLFQDVTKLDRSYGNLVKSVREVVTRYGQEIYRDTRMVAKFRTLNRGQQPVETVVYKIEYPE